MSREKFLSSILDSLMFDIILLLSVFWKKNIYNILLKPWLSIQSIKYTLRTWTNTVILIKITIPKYKQNKWSDLTNDKDNNFAIVTKD